MPYFQSGDAKIHYQTWGEFNDRPVLTLVNGYTRSLTDFRGMVKALQSESLSIIALDNRGSGKTESGLDFTLEDLAQDILGLWNHLGVSKSSLLGISMGGLISQVLLRANEEAVDKLILVSTSPHPDRLRQEEPPWVADMVALEAKLGVNFSENFLKNNRLLLKAMAKNILETLQSSDFADKAKAQKQAIAKTPSNYFDYQSQKPMLIIHGDEDRVIPVDAARQFVRKFPNAVISEFTGKGHLLIAESPTKLYEEVTAYLQ